MCENDAEETCSECDQDYCMDNKALKIGSICLNCGGEQARKNYRGQLAVFFVILFVVIPIWIISMMSV